MSPNKITASNKTPRESSKANAPSSLGTKKAEAFAPALWATLVGYSVTTLPTTPSSFGAKKAEAYAPAFLASLVGVTGFEPATSCSQSKRATKLRHTPRPVQYTPDRLKLKNPSQLAKSEAVRYTDPVAKERTRECSLMVKPQPSKLMTRVRFPSLAPRARA